MKCLKSYSGQTQQVLSAWTEKLMTELRKSRFSITCLCVSLSVCACACGCKAYLRVWCSRSSWAEGWPLAFHLTVKLMKHPQEREREGERGGGGVKETALKNSKRKKEEKTKWEENWGERFHWCLVSQVLLSLASPHSSECSPTSLQV